MSPGANTVTAPAPGADGLLVHARRLGASVLEHVAMRVELLSIEVQEEKARVARQVIGAALVTALLIVSLVMLAILILAIYWDTPDRVPAAFALLGAFVAATAGAGVYLAAQLRQSTTLFASSASEFRRDAKAMVPAQSTQSLPS